MSDEKLSEQTEMELREAVRKGKWGGFNSGDWNHAAEVTADAFRPLLARLEREKERWRRAIEGLTPSGSEFYNDPEYCAEYIRKRTQYPKMIIELREQVARLERERDAARSEVLDALYVELDKSLLLIAQGLNDGEYHTVITHAIMPTVLGAIVRARNSSPSVVSQPSREREVLEARLNEHDRSCPDCIARHVVCERRIELHRHLTAMSASTGGQS